LLKWSIHKELKDYDSPTGHFELVMRRLNVAGAKSPKAIAKWWQNRQDASELLQRLGFTNPYGLSQFTL
jgi:hypothetical protein